MYPNPLKQRLQAGELVLGTSSVGADPHVVGAVLGTKPDFLWIDTEHMPFGAESLSTLPVICRMRGVAPMIRVAWNDPALIKKACDVGAVVIMVPQINTAEAAARAVEYARYAPQGQRGLSPMWTRIAGTDWNEVIRTANDEIVLVLQIESQEAFDNLDAIKQVPGIDVLLVGPLDLSASVGTITDTKSEAVLEILREVPRRLQGTGIVAGTTMADMADLQEKARWGYRFLNVGNALGYGLQVLQRNLDTLRRDPRGEA